jgi:hypothetical protein
MIEFVNEWVVKSPEILFEFADFPHWSLYYAGLYLAKSQGFYTNILTWLTNSGKEWTPKMTATKMYLLIFNFKDVM